MSSSELVAQVCLYGARETGYAYLASAPELSSPIVAEGGWSAHDPSSPSGELRSLSETIERAKRELRALGLSAGVALVCFPAGERCARTPIERYERVGDMKLEPAPLVRVTAEAIDQAARRLTSQSSHIVRAAVHDSTDRRSSPRVRSPEPGRRSSPPLGRTSTGKPIPRVPEELGALERAATQASATGGAMSEEASRAMRAAQSALRAHVDSYAREFTAAEHCEAASRVEDEKRARFGAMDRYLRYAHNGVALLHERAADELDEAERRRRLR